MKYVSVLQNDKIRLGDRKIRHSTNTFFIGYSKLEFERVTVAGGN